MVVTDYLQLNEDPSSDCNTGMTALSMAAMKGHATVVHLLLS